MPFSVFISMPRRSYTVCFVDCESSATTLISVVVPSLWVMITDDKSIGADTMASLTLNQQRKPPRVKGASEDTGMSVPSLK